MPDVQYLPDLGYLKTLILGFIQGLTEFLPVSSTAHMRVIPALLHWPDPGAAFSAIVQLGPIVAIIAYFRRDLIRYLAGIGRSLQQRILFPAGDTDARLGWFTVLGTVPLIVFGLALEKKVDNEYRNLYFVAAALIILAFVLMIAESRARQTVTVEKMTFRDAMIVGLAQALAIVPGASRSGCTITAGLFLGLTREDAARFSFLLSIPAITLAGLYKLAKTLHQTGTARTGRRGRPLPVRRRDRGRGRLRRHQAVSGIPGERAEHDHAVHHLPHPARRRPAGAGLDGICGSRITPVTGISPSSDGTEGRSGSTIAANVMDTVWRKWLKSSAIRK